MKLTKKYHVLSLKAGEKYAQILDAADTLEAAERFAAGLLAQSGQFYIYIVEVWEVE